jgi:hypothetical protein
MLSNRCFRSDGVLYTVRVHPRDVGPSRQDNISDLVCKMAQSLKYKGHGEYVASLGSRVFIFKVHPSNPRILDLLCEESKKNRPGGQ